MFNYTSMNGIDLIYIWKCITGPQTSLAVVDLLFVSGCENVWDGGTAETECKRGRRGRERERKSERCGCRKPELVCASERPAWE